MAVAGSDPADAVVKNLEYPNATDYLALPADTYDLEVRLAGTTTVALPLPGVAVEDCNAYSVFAIGSAASPAVGDNALQVVVAVDATASDEAGTTPPPTDTVAQNAPSGSSSFGLAALLLGLMAVVSFAVSSRRLATRRVRQDEG